MSYLSNDGLLYFWQKLKNALAGKVDAVSGKGLSTNDYTDADRNKVAGMDTAISTAITQAISGITSFEFQKVESLPATGTKGVIYLLAHSHGTGDGFDEYIWIDNGYEKLGHADIDLSGYMLTSSKITNAEIDTILAS